MKINKTTKTIEEITSYEAFDGTQFKTESECIKYEESAHSAVKKAAWHYLVAERADDAVFTCCEDSLCTFDVPDTTAYNIIRHWMELANLYHKELFTPDYIGKRVGVMHGYGDDFWFYSECATKEQMLKFYTERIEKLFADKETE